MCGEIHFNRVLGLNVNVVGLTYLGMAEQLSFNLQRGYLVPGTLLGNIHHYITWLFKLLMLSYLDDVGGVSPQDLVIVVGGDLGDVARLEPLPDKALLRRLFIV